MKGFLYPVLGFLAAVLAALLADMLMKDNGYVLIQFLGFVFETSVPGLILWLLALYFSVRLIVRLMRSVFGVGKAARAIRVRQARQRTARGLLDISEGNYARGERLLARSAHVTDTPVLNYLGAAQAAQRQGATERRDNWLMLAYENDPKSTGAVLLTQAELQMADGQYEQALATLNRLEEQSAGHPRAARLLADIYRTVDDWASLEQLLPRLKKNRSMNPAEFAALSLTVYTHRLDEATKSGDADRVESQWQACPKALRTDPVLLKRYLNGLVACGAHARAEAIIRKRLKKTWDPELVTLYGLLDTGTPQQLLARAEGWLGTRGEDPVLLLTAARLASACELWGKARSYLETSLAIRPDPDSYRAYGELLERLGESVPAIEAFRAGLALATGTPTTAPALAGPVSPAAAAEIQGADKVVRGGSQV